MVWRKVSVRTDGLQGQGRCVEEEQDDVQKVEDSLDMSKRGSMFVDPGKRDIDGSGPHTNWELTFC